MFYAFTQDFTVVILRGVSQIKKEKRFVFPLSDKRELFTTKMRK